MKVCVVGTGYVGLTTGASLAFLGHKVTCLDIDEAKVELLRGGKSPIFEPFIDDLLAEAAPNLTFTSSYADAIAGAEVVFVAVQTPQLPDGGPDLRYLRSAAESIGQHVGRWSWRTALRHTPPPKDFSAASSQPRRPTACPELANAEGWCLAR